jgi:ribose transport system ATP-binding protein
MNITFSAKNVTKRYGGVVALADGALSVRSGEVLALMGANGSGKSTLSKIITGVVAPDDGQLLLDGQPQRFSSPHMARAHGIAAVYQELSLIPDLTVAENIWLAHEPTRLGRVNTRAIARRTAELLELFSRHNPAGPAAGQPGGRATAGRAPDHRNPQNAQLRAAADHPG